MSALLCFLDTETTGVHPGRKVWEVGMIRREPDGVERETSFFVGVNLAKADPFGLSIGRFYERHPRGPALSGATSYNPPTHSGLKTPAQAAQMVASWTHGAHIVGAVPNFDTEVLAKLLRRHRLIPGWHYHLIDVENLAVGYIAGRWGLIDEAEAVTLPWKSDDLNDALGLDPTPEDERHTALGDAKWAMRIYDKVMGR